MNSTAPSKLPSAPWVDNKRYLWILGLLVPIMPFLAWMSYGATGSSVSLWGGPIFVYSIIPLLDWIFGEDRENPPVERVKSLESDWYYRWIVFLYIPLQYASTVFAAWVVMTQDLSWFGIAGMLFTVGFTNGIGINTAHELGHKNTKLEKWLAKITLAPVAYGHFFVEHNRGHHVRVATPEDPATSRMGESFWHFLPRTVFGSLSSAWSLEKKRLEKMGLSVWHWRNENFQAWSMTVVLFGALTAWLGWAVLPFLLLQAAYGASLLEVVNYVEHYGLLRKKKANGRYERCQPEHSWNSNHTTTNLFLYHLQRHSDHHANPSRRYQSLRHFEEAPQLPQGYAGMVFIAYLPWLWYRVMDHRVVEHYRGDLTQANLYPPRRDALLAKWGKTASA